MAANPGPKNGWVVRLFGSLCYQTFDEYLSLKRAHDGTHLANAPLLAWHARNLLELSVWSIYCARSKEGARRVYEDGGRDAREIIDTFIRWGTATSQATDWFDPLETMRKDFAEKARLREGIESVEGRYMQVNDAAKECGIGEQFGVMNKVLSKFAHPTAMRILSSDKWNTLPRDLFFSNGCVFFVGAFDALEGAVKRISTTSAE